MRSRRLGNASPHFRFQFDGLAIHNECTASMMVDRFGIHLSWIRPGLEHFEDEEVVFVHKARIGHFAFEVGETFSDQWRRHMVSRNRRQTERLKFIDVAARRIADLDNLRRQRLRWNGNHTFPGCP